MAEAKIKICGISTPEALEAAIAARADFVGLNFFAPSPRYVDTGIAARFAARAKGRIAVVGVFVDPDEAALAETVEAAQLDAIQFHGAESAERLAQARARFGLPVWKVLSIATRDDLDRSAAYAGAADFLLLDAKTPKGAVLPGGMGLAFDWSLLAGWKPALPWGLAGGLNAANVAEAIRLTGASLVDTASGVESAPGIKDEARIAEFCAAVRSE